MITVYGIKNCDTVKKALKWLDLHQHTYQFHDFRTQGLDEKLLQSWVERLGWEALLNKRGTTWRKLPEALKQEMNKNTAITIMLEHSTVIKRPVLVSAGTLMVGFDTADYNRQLNG